MTFKYEPKHLDSEDIELLKTFDVSKYDYFKYDNFLELLSLGFHHYRVICDEVGIYFSDDEKLILDAIITKHGYLFHIITDYYIYK